MKKIIVTLLLIFFVSALHAQQPVTWRYTAKKISKKVYEVHITAVMQQGWHIYSGQQPEDAFVVPTRIEFSKDPIFALSGSIKEIGKIEKYKDPLGTEAYCYGGQVHFVQKVKMRGKARSVLAGNITYQACTDEKCLMPETVNFDIPVSE